MMPGPRQRCLSAACHHTRPQQQPSKPWLCEECRARIASQPPEETIDGRPINRSGLP